MLRLSLLDDESRGYERDAGVTGRGLSGEAANPQTRQQKGRTKKRAKHVRGFEAAEKKL
jgi:hypothetical protein